ncbi:class I SAM-dependent methyltransferase [uncultured Methanoregula sp.]|uniref:class I SAM-dependent methyltransferase n=1 Tax=uncultured Methanoregula sp. TaxID=1005933 RepID=UPI002AAB456B|nr:class I SAM-dependent methyltransferase [uncultured Methanoregula sp.]
MMHHADRDTWDKDYSKRGNLWSGAVHALPVLPAFSRVLELGCGNGKTLAGMIPCGWDVVATDFSLAAVSLSRKAVRGDSSCTVVLSDARFSPFCSESFDAIFAWHILGHLTKLDRILSVFEITRILRPGGYIFFSEFSEEDFRFGKGAQIEPGTFIRGNGIRTHYFTMDEVRDLFTCFDEESLGDRAWTMRIRGNDFVRSEIKAVFAKRGR